MAFYQWRIGGYTRQIYLDGTTTFEVAIAADIRYEQAIKEYAAKNFYYGQIDDAFTKLYITQTVYDETIALKTAIEPRNGTNLIVNPTS